MSNNIFEDVLKNANSVQDKLLGPSYPYFKNIKTPSELGMSDRGTIRQMGKNITGLIDYVEVLVTGDSRASRTGGPLGNKFFLQTGAKCISPEGEQVNRHIYINNIPSGNIPFISAGLGTNFSEFRGLIPGVMGNLNALNPFAIMQSFLSGATPDCQPLTMETVDINNNRSSETHYVTLVDIQNMDPCWFKDRKNPVSGQKCRETFEPQTQNFANDAAPFEMPDDPVAQLYFMTLAGLGVYIFYRLMEKSK